VSESFPALLERLTHFHGNAGDSSWALSDAIAKGDVGYASYEFRWAAA